MKYNKFVVTITGLLSFFISNYGRTWKGILSEVSTFQLKQQAIMNEDDDVSALFKTAMNDANKSIDDLFYFDQLNHGKHYINCLQEEQPLIEENLFYMHSMSDYSKKNQEVEQTFLNYYSVNTSFENLYRIYHSNFSVTLNQLNYYEDFVCDTDLVNYITHLNGGFQNNLSLGLPNQILNPSPFGVDNIYDIQNINCSVQSSINNSSQEPRDTTKYQVLGGASIVTLTTALLNIGLSYSAIETMKCSFLSIKAAITYWLPWIAKLIIITAAIVALTIVLVTYWKQIRSIIDSIIDMFIALASDFASSIGELFDNIIASASKTDYDKQITVDGEAYYTKIITFTNAHDFSKLGKKVFHRAFISGDSIFISNITLKKDQAKNVLTRMNESYLHNIYTFRRDDAFSVMSLAFPGARIFYDYNHHSTNGNPFALEHYHADYSSNIGLEHSIKNHSFFGAGKSV